MFISKSEESGENTERSLYGDPQHEEDVENEWETEYYGEPNVEEPPGPTEFVPDVEPWGRFGDDEGATPRFPESSTPGPVASAYGRS